MNCTECRDQLVILLEGLGDEGLSARMEKHVAECLGCRQELAALRELQNRLRHNGQAPSGVPIESAVMDQILQRQTLKIRKTHMRNRILAWSAAAAAVIALPLVLFVVFGKSASPAYALDQTVEAVRSLTTVHLTCDPPGPGVGELWAEFDATGQLRLARLDFPASEDGPKVVVWKRDVAEVWFKQKNSVLVLRDPQAIADLAEKIRQLDPKESVERLYRAQTEGRGDVLIGAPAAEGAPITITWTVQREKQQCQDVYQVDPETKLLRRLDKYVLKDGEYVSAGSILIAGYNERIDPAVFNPPAPADATRIDWTRQEVGLPQGTLNNEEIAAKVAREFFEALIAQNYAKAGQLYAGMPEARMKEVFGKITFMKIVSIGAATPNADARTGFLDVPCEVQLKDADGKVVRQKLVAKVRPVHGQNGRWAIDGGI
jgi:hypothetical protein